MLMQFAPFIAIFAIMYFLILRPQQRRAKDQKALVQGARRGDTVVTSGEPVKSEAAKDAPAKKDA